MSNKPTKTRAARPAGRPAAPAPVALADGTEVAFSVSAWLAANGLTAAKPVEVAGRVYRFKTTGTIEENVAVARFFATGQYREALAVLLETPAEAEDLAAGLQLPFDTTAEGRFWDDFLTAVTGVSMGEAAAS